MTNPKRFRSADRNDAGMPQSSGRRTWNDRYDLVVSTTDSVFTFDPSFPGGVDGSPRQPRLLWAAPGSLFVEKVEEAWTHRTHLADLGKVGGPWGVVLWDPAQGHVLAGDPVGVQPLFCARTSSGQVAVASHLAALVDRLDVDDTLDEEGTLLELLRSTTPDVAHRTPFRSVRRVPWGCALIVGPDGTWRQVRYWDPADLAGPDHSLTPDDCAELLRERIDAAVARLLPTDGTGVGAHVSGGLDCTTVACRANQLLVARGSALVAGYSWSPNVEKVARRGHDERDLLDEVTAQERLVIRTLGYGDDGRWFDDLDPCRYPMSTHNFERYLLPAANLDGVTTLLSGWGGDELASFNGRAVTKRLLRSGQWGEAWRHSEARLRIRAAGPVPVTTQVKAFASDLRNVFTPQRQSPVARFQSAELDRIASVSPLAAQSALQSGVAIAAAADHHAYQLALVNNGHLQHRCGWWFQTGHLFGINYRYPLLDLGVVAASLQLPWWAYRSQGWNRLAFRRAAEVWVPANVVWSVLKSEPALHAVRTDIITNGDGNLAEPRRHRPVHDDAYQRLVDLAQEKRSHGMTEAPDLDLVITRPEAAPAPTGALGARP